MDVWICESGNYEDRYVVGVYATLDDAVACTKARYGAAYKVIWHDLKRDDAETASLVGDFAAVPGYSTTHSAHFNLTLMPVQTASALSASRT